MHGDRASTHQPPWLQTLFRPIVRRWPAVLAAGLVGLALASVYLHVTPPVYGVVLRVHAAPSSSGRQLSRLGSLAALAGLSGSAADSSPFRYFLDGVYAPEVAARLARDPALLRAVFPAEWDAGARRWRQPPSLLRGVRDAVYGALGVPATPWRAPDADRLQAWIAKQVTVGIGVKTPISTIAVEHRDPVFAANFLEKLGAATDDYLRARQSARTAGNIRYLSERLAATSLTDQRESIAAQLVEQERQGMLAGSSASYAADNFGPAVATLEPVWPRPVLLLLGCTLAGLLLGAVGAVVHDRRQSRRF